MAINWHSAGLTHLEQHERDSFHPELLKDREHAGVNAGDLYADPGGTLWLRATDGAHLIAGDVDGHEHELLVADDAPQTAQSRTVENARRASMSPEETVMMDAKIERDSAKMASDSARLDSMEAKIEAIYNMIKKVTE